MTAIEEVNTRVGKVEDKVDALKSAVDYITSLSEALLNRVSKVEEKEGPVRMVRDKEEKENFERGAE